MQKLRVVREEDTEDFHNRLEEILDELGIPVGGEIVISTRSDYTVDDLTENSAVRGKTDESAEAAEQVFPRTGTKRWEVVAALSILNKASRKQLCEITDMKPDTLRPRVLECIDGGWVKQSTDCPYIDDEEILELTELGTNELARTQ
jgi:hypothetical protein